jgi:type II secretory pathway pseudopilin PulG
MILAVIAIMALLAALITPAVSKKMDRVKKTACAGHLTQIGQGLSQFRIEHRGNLPTREGGNGYHLTVGKRSLVFWAFIGRKLPQRSQYIDQFPGSSK